MKDFNSIVIDREVKKSNRAKLKNKRSSLVVDDEVEALYNRSASKELKEDFRVAKELERIAYNNNRKDWRSKKKDI